MNGVATALDRVDGSTGSVRYAAEHVLSCKPVNFKNIVDIMLQKLRTVATAMSVMLFFIYANKSNNVLQASSQKKVFLLFVIDCACQVMQLMIH